MKQQCFPSFPFFTKRNKISENYNLDFPSGSMDKNLPTNAGDTGSTLDPGRFHMPRSNSSAHHASWAHTPQLLKAGCPEPVLRSERPPQQGAHARQLESRARLPQLEKTHTQRQRRSTAKINKWMKWTIQWEKKMPSQTKLLKFTLLKKL